VSASIIDGKKIAAAVRDDVTERVSGLTRQGVVPGLAAVLVGDDPASVTYVESIKGKACTAAGMTPFIRRLPAATTQKELTGEIQRLNEDPEIHGIIVQIPLPLHLDPMIAQAAVDPSKDVDGLHPENAGLLALGDPRFIPCTPYGVKILLEKTGIKVEGAHIVVVGRSNLVGRPLSILLSQKADGANATVTLCHTGTVDLQAHTRAADILIAAAGTPKGITGEMVKPGATVIDVGINRTEDGLIGDVDFESVSEVADAITPVPGGVGPMTVAMLLSNTVQAATYLGGIAAY
jgi:methylenetetrahydrofolate dehydrogenase (NADP+) / methenyltetrahydrofolate cyclohydrolase